MAFGGVDQLAHVARPVMPEQPSQLARWQARCLTAMALRSLVGEVFEQQRNVFTAFTQRRNPQGGDIQPVVEVFTETPSLDLVEQVRFDRADHPQIDLNAAVGTQAFEGFLLQHAQQFDLLGQRQAFHLIEKQRAAVGMLDAADTLALGAGKGAAFMAEQLALEQVLGNRRAVQRDKRLAGAVAEIMQATGNPLLAAAGVAAQEDIHRGAGQFEDLPTQGFHRPRDAEQLRLDMVFKGELLTQLAVLADQTALVQRAAHAVEQAFGGKGLFDKVIGALAQRLHRHRHIAMPGDQNHRQIAVALQHAVEQLQAIGAGHAHIADDDAGVVTVDQRQRGLRRGAAVHAKAGQLQPLLHRLADGRFIVDDYYVPSHITSPSLNRRAV